ncbi:hypothetical protein D3C85_493340 [compost metagenome]
MAKEIGYTYAIATRNPKQTFVFCKWFTTLQQAIDYAIGEVKDRSQYDVEFILIREGVTNTDDPIIWDSRKDMPKPTNNPWAKTLDQLNPTPLVEEPVIHSPIRLKIEELYGYNNFDTDTFEQLIKVLDEMEKTNGNV